MEELFSDGFYHDLALAKRAYPEQRFGQLIVNAMIGQSKQYVNCPELFYMTDDKLVEGLRRLFEKRLIPFEHIKKELDL